MKWMGIVSIDGDLVSDGAAGSQEEAKQRAETLMEKTLKSRPDQHGLVHFRARKADWSRGWMSDERPYGMNLSKVHKITTTVARCRKESR